MRVTAVNAGKSTYIRFWQADGESEKTSIRTKTALGQIVEDGGFKGGVAPYGYDLVKSGRLNKRKHELYELAVNESEADVVRIIFEKYVNEGFGAQRIATYLNRLGYRARTSKNWHHATIRGIICNLTYTGILRSGESRSQVLSHLQLIPQEMFEAAQRIRTSRANAAEKERTVPRNIRGQSLLSGNVFCGHCGARLTLTTNGRAYPCAADPNRIVMDTLNAQYNDIISWAEMYDNASMEAKKMIVNCLIKRVEVYRDYKLHIDFNIDLEQFSMGMDIMGFVA